MPRVQMADGSQLRVLRVEVGTNSAYSKEQLWKRAIRYVCPNRWEAALLGNVPKGPFHRTRQDSLFVWVTCDGTNGQAPRDTKIWQRMFVTLRARSEAPAIPAIFGSFPSVACLEFRSYARHAPRILLRIWNGVNDVPFEIPNPHPVRPARWTAGSIPQTNRFPGTDIILQRTAGFHASDSNLIVPRLAVRSHVGESAGWVEWRLTARDAWGNWTDAGWPTRTPNPRFEWSCDGVWQLVADGIEYISAGFVPLLTNGAAFTVPVGLRASQFGVRSLMAVGAGVYRIEDGVVAFQPDIPVDAGSRSRLSATPALGPKVWQADLMAPYPGILCVSDGETDYAARLRARPGNFDGGNWTATKLQVNGKRFRFQFFSRTRPASEDRLEVEVFGSLPTAEFFLPPTGFRGSTNAPPGA